MSDSEITTLAGYVVFLADGTPVTVTDTFLSAIEAAEMKALEMTQEIDAENKTVSIIENDAEVTAEGFFGQWKQFDEAEGDAELYVFHRYRKPDGYLLAGAWRQKPLRQPTIKVACVPVDFFNGVYVSFDDEDLESGDEDEDEASGTSSGDETYVEK